MKKREIFEFLNVSHDTPYHKENILAHTLWCMQNSKTEFLKYVSLFHDIGKPIVKDGGKYYGHEGVSIHKMWDFIKPQDLKHLSLKDLLYVINYHSIFYKKFKAVCDILPEEVMRFIRKFAEIDNKSRITEKEENIMIDYDCKEKEKEETNEKLVIVMVGVPGSGKDTFINHLLQGIPVISRDDIVEELAGGEYRFDEVDQDKVNQILDERMKEYSQKYGKVVINMTNCSEKSRRRNLRYFQNWRKRYIVLIEPFSELVRRNENRGLKKLPEKVLIDFMRKFQLPEYEKSLIYVKGEKI